MPTEPPRQPDPDTATLGVNAGRDQRILLALGTAALAGRVTYTGPRRDVRLQWSVVQGDAGAVRFRNAAAARTTARFAQPGEYVLRLLTDDGWRTAYDDVVRITVERRRRW